MKIYVYGTEEAYIFNIKIIFWFHFDKLRYAHYRSSFVSLIAMQSFKAVTPIEKAGETMKVLIIA